MIIFSKDGKRAYLDGWMCFGVYRVGPKTTNLLKGNLILDGIVLTEDEARKYLCGERIDILRMPDTFPFDLSNKNSFTRL